MNPTKGTRESPVYGVAPAVLACLAMVFLPACGSMQQVRDPAPHMVTVTEPDGRAYLAPAASVGVAKIDRHAGEWCCADFNCPGDGWTQLVILGFYALGYAIYYLGYGVYWCVEAVVDACADTGDEPEEPDDSP